MMALQERLEKAKAELREVTGKENAAVLDQGTEKLRQSGIEDGAIKIGKKIDSFTLPDAVGNSFSLAEVLKEGPVVISFFRGGWCPYCNIELRAFQNLLPEFEKYGASLVAVSPQTPDNSLSTKEKEELSFAVLSDQGNVVARKFGLVFKLDDSVREIYKGFEIDLAFSNGDKSYELPLPGTFVIDKDGVVRFAFVDVDYTMRAEPAEILDMLKSM